MGNLEYTISGRSRGVKSYNLGTVVPNRIIITDTLPEHTTLSQESKDAGWSFDESTRVATFIKDINENNSNTSISQKIKLKVLDTFPDSYFNKPLINNATVKFEFDGMTLSRDVSNAVEPRVLPVFNDKGVVSFEKTRDTADSTGVKTIGSTNSYPADLHIKKNGDSNIFYSLNPTINNYGDNQPVRIDEIIDHIQDNRTRLRGIYINKRYNNYDVFPEGAELYAINTSGVKTKVEEEIKMNKYIGLPDDTVRFELKFPDNYKFPAHIDNNKSYIPFYLQAFYKVVDRSEFLNNIPKDGVGYYDVQNEGILKSPEGEIVKMAINRFHREGVPVTNNIQSNERLITTNKSIKLNQYISVTNYKHINDDDIADLTNKQLVYLFSKELGLDVKARECVANGKCKFFDNYKNTGKKALVIDNVEKNDMRRTLRDFLRVEETTPNGEHQIELITTWDENDINYGTASDDLDFRNDGSTTSRNVARSTATIRVLKPEQVAIRKYVNNPQTVSGYGQDISDFRPTDLIDWRISVINISDRPLHSSRVLEVLPYESDKKIVAGNDGTLENRGTTAGSKLVGPIPAQNGFTITYSTDAPGANETESWAKNFVPENQIADWSQVRMIKIVQNADHIVPPQTVINFHLQSKIDENAPDNSEIKNSAAVSISSAGGLVEADVVTARIEHDAIVRGIAFEDKNNNGIFDQDTDILLPGYKVKLVRYYGGGLIGETETAQDGSYSIRTRGILYQPLVIRFEKKNDGMDLIPQQYDDRTLTNLKSNIASTDTNTNPNEFVSYSFSFSNNRKLVIRNLGVKDTTATLKVRYLNTAGQVIKDEIVVKNREVLNPDSPTPYDVTSLKDQEITAKDGLVYTFQKKKDNDPADTGNLVEGETVITYIYEPKQGGNVKAKFVIGDTNEELKTEETVYVASNQVGTSYDAESKLKKIDEANNQYEARPTELTKDNLVYTYRSVRASGAPAVGKVKTEEQTVIFEYVPKAGSSVKVQFYNEEGVQIKPEATIYAEGTQIGKEYSSAPFAEITYQGVTYVYKVLKNDSAPQAGRVKETPQIIKYVYTPKKGGQVIVNYVNQEGQTITSTKVVKATDTPVGTPYNDTPPQEITADDGLVYVYELLKSGKQNGNVKAETQEIVYQYKKKEGGEVKAKFVDEEGNELKDEVVVAARGTQVGSSYTATKDNEITKDGLVYIFKKRDENSASETGKVVAGTQTVVYVYTKKSGGSVIAKYLDRNGNELKEMSTISPKGTQVGTPYQSNKPNTIEVNGKKYKLVEVKGEETGKVIEGDIKVIYIYEETSDPVAPNTGFNKFIDNSKFIILAIAVLGLSTLAIRKKAYVKF